MYRRFLRRVQFVASALGPGINPMTFIVTSPDSDTRNVIQPTGDFVPLTLKGFTVQTHDMFRIVDSNDVPIVTVTGPDAAGGGTLQVGTVDTSAFLAVTRTRTETSGSGRGILANITVTPPSNSTAAFRALFTLITSTGTANLNTLEGANYQVSHNSTGTITRLAGMRPQTTNASAGGLATGAYGVDTLVQSNAANTITDAFCYNSAISVGVSGGVMTRAHHINLATPVVAAGGSIGTCYGVRIKNQGTALIGTSYAIDIDNQVNSTTPFSIRSQGGQCLFQAGTATVVPVTVQGAASQSASNFVVANSSSVALFDVAAGGITTHRLVDTTTNTVSDALIIDHTTSGTPAAGFGQTLRFRAKSSTTTSRNLGLTEALWATATDATRKGQVNHYASDNTTDRLYLRGETDGTNAMIGFLGAAAVVRQVGASAAGIAAITDANAKAAISALQTALANLGLVTSPA